jgi:hypothetical protein
MARKTVLVSDLSGAEIEEDEVVGSGYELTTQRLPRPPRANRRVQNESLLASSARK